MGYESRVFVVNVTRHKKPQSDEVIWSFGQVLAGVNMSCMEASFSALFKTPIDFETFLDDPDVPTEKDKYGDNIKATKVQEVITYLENKIEEGERYRRLKPLLGLLKGYNESEWDELLVLHYGY